MNKKDIPLNNANRLINAGAVVLVSTLYKDRPNVFTVAWNMPVSHSPICVAIASGKSNYSTKIIEETKEFVINIPDASMKEEVINCGSVSGENVEKFKRFELTPLKSKKIKAPGIKECIGHLECTLEKFVDIYDHIVFIAKVVAAYVDEDKWDFDDNVWIPEKAEVIQHLGGKYFAKIKEI
ncbi:MAG TPA: flavin reductase family protein [Candidatus Atribacteria bacterium]|nr:flavin reductase family protein [Candidatus Atribacteria bacterium]